MITSHTSQKMTTLILAIIFLFVFIYNTTSASPIDELKSKINERNNEIGEIEEEITKYQIQVDEKEREAKTFSNEIYKINTRISKLNADIRWTKRNIDKTELEIEKLGLEISEKEKRIKQNKLVLADLIRNMYEMESESLVEILLKNEELSDFFDNLQNIENLEKSIKTNLDSLRAVKNELENDRLENKAEKSNMISLKSGLADRKTIEYDAKENKQNLLSITKNQEAEYQKLLSDRERARKEILKEIASIEDEMKKLINPKALPDPRAGVLGQPLKDLIITQGFGMTEFAKNNSNLYAGGGHNGIDFRAPVGTRIYAAEGGVVLNSGNTDLSCPKGSYGKWIVVEHKNNLATLYAHLSLIKVNKGDIVSRGELIGYSGNSGYSTGPHLHLTVYASGSAGEIRFGPSPSGRCDLLPYGGYLNPLNYL